jgi:dTDP-4-dehydrorhamnose 3,5-epimerase
VIFHETALPGAWVIEPERFEDERGFFARTFCREDFAARGLEPAVAQCNVSYNHRRGTLRGMHYQVPPGEEAKLVRCTRGAIFDAVVDLREGSPGLGRFAAVELTAENRLALYVPPGFAHGFQTLTDDCEVFYQMSVPYASELARGFAHDDPAVGIPWPLPVAVISERDRGLPGFADRAGRADRAERPDREAGP